MNFSFQGYDFVNYYERCKTNTNIFSTFSYSKASMKSGAPVVSTKTCSLPHASVKTHSFRQLEDVFKPSAMWRASSWEDPEREFMFEAESL